MALIQVGAIDDFSVSVKATAKAASLKNIRTLSALREVSREVPSDSFDFITSREKRGVALKKLELTRGFEGFLQGVFDPTNEVFFVAWSWDLSGHPIYQYPGTLVDPADVIIPLKVGRVKDFIGEGVNLFPKRKVKGGISIRIKVWESDQKTRNFGKAMADTAEAIKKSRLSNLLSLISLSTGISGATITLIKEASLELAAVIGTILQANGDDYVDLFEGYYPADLIWQTQQDTYQGNSSIVTLNKY